MRMRCHLNGGTCGYFTDGKIYDTDPTIAPGRIAQVTDDHGHSRVIPIDGSLCAHIVMNYGNPFRPHTCVGTWERVE